MTAQEFFNKHNGEYFDFLGEDVRIVGYGSDNMLMPILVSKKNGWNLNDLQANEIEYIDKSLISKNDKLWFTNIDFLIQINQPILNLCTMLKGCDGITLYSSIHGNVILEYIDSTISYPIIVTLSDGDSVGYCKDGRYLSMYDGECTLFPSKQNRDWSTFEKPNNKKVLKEGDYVMCGDNVFQTELRQYFKDNKCYASGINDRRSILKAEWKYIIPFEDYDPSLSEEELKKLSIV